MADGFLGRWARRKEAVRKGEPVAEEKPREEAAPGAPAPAGVAAIGAPTQPAAASSSAAAPGRPEVAPEPPPPPTLADTESLTPESDFRRFVRPDVDPAVKNAALKKLFADPHFNVMDRLDIYIDDYSKPDPMPPEMLRQLAGAKFLHLFDEEQEAQAQPLEPAARANADVPAAESVAQSGSRTEQALSPAEDHADPDLRLQQDDAPGPPGPGAGPR